MGKPEESDTCIDKDFRIVGLEGLRVVDMSVAPIMPKSAFWVRAYFVPILTVQTVTTPSLWCT
jgi:hypothetical protein